MTQDHTDNHAQHSTYLKGLMATTAAVGGVITAPYLLPIVGIGSERMAEMAMTAMHATTPLGIGLAGQVNGLLNGIPLIGTQLAAGGIMTAVTSGVIGIGGVLISKWMEKQEAENPEKSSIQWSKVIRYAALATSILIALPSLLTGISAGITFLAAAFGSSAAASATATALSGTLGAMGSLSIAQSGASLLATTIPHLFICGSAILPAALALFMASSPKREAEPQPARRWQDQVEQSRMPDREPAIAR